MARIEGKRGKKKKKKKKKGLIELSVKHVNMYIHKGKNHRSNAEK